MVWYTMEWIYPIVDARHSGYAIQWICYIAEILNDLGCMLGKDPESHVFLSVLVLKKVDH